MKDYNIRQMQRLAVKYFPYDDGLLGHIARATGEVIAAKTEINFIDCCIKFLVFTEREGVVLSIEEARTTQIISPEATLLGMLSQVYVYSRPEVDGELRGPCQRYFNALFAMAAKRKVKMIELTDGKLSIYDSIK